GGDRRPRARPPARGGRGGARGVVIWGAVYVGLLGALLVRVRHPGAPPVEPARATPGEPIWLVNLHHLLFYALLAGAPLERALAVLVLALRVKLEDDALARTFPEYWRYAARTKRIVPFVF